MSDPSYSVEVIRSNIGKYTHTIKLSTTRKIITATKIKVQLINQLPKWVEASNDDDGLDINASDAMSKTYGIKYLIGGVFDAYTLQDNVYAEFDIKIN